MNTAYIDVDGRWGVVLCYDLMRMDEWGMRRSMMSFGMRGSHIDDAVDVLLGGENTGMCVSADDIKMSLVFIGDATSDDQWWDTVSHELYHAATAICGYYGVRPGSEGFAWTMGYLMRKAVQLFGMCEEAGDVPASLSPTPPYRGFR